ncbi:AFR389Cp [Eremothecium gossypii ATCC 10895]|uniref:AFR389Cp n=1 Tax=Eremothecium gossypii (strain ATCC 10895 / CBS 109.51 / FGSC 9923 / NRRL Y-1056) TaxID=284811 RepID=Q753C7_EREGS|nr:AFR389Cp [Eremothecium gossypii ATCC 10895]AAS53760.2 AFR389Cp [Eremothecium gossypii ATCC 10895]
MAKKPVRLTSLLTGYRQKGEGRARAGSSAPTEGDSVILDTTTEDIDEESMLKVAASQPHAALPPSDAKKRSVADVLMGNRQQGTREVITIEDQDALAPATPSAQAGARRAPAGTTLKEVLTGCEKRRKVEPAESADKEQQARLRFEQAHENLMRSLTNTKKTKAKDLFSHFPKKELARFPEAGSAPPADGGPHRPLKRRHEVSGLSELTAPWPGQQLIADAEAIPARTLSLGVNRLSSPCTLLLDEQDYAGLNKRHDNTGSCFQSVVFPEDYEAPRTLWTERFKPKRLDDVVIATKVKKAVANWVASAFQKLRRPTSRSVLLQRSLAASEDIREFIIEGDDDMTDEGRTMEEFVPLMILYGETGKSTLLDVIMNELGGEIYEINTSANRGRKNIWENIKEFSTTHFVKNTGSKGLIVFDDVDVLFNERDRFFWSAVEKTLLISRRPIVLTCHDFRNIPMNLVQIAKDQESFFHVRKVKTEYITKYLKSSLSSINVGVPDDELDRIVKDSHRDIRQCMLQLQWLCTRPAKKLQNADKHIPQPTTLEAYATNADILSQVDILQTGTANRSLFQHELDKTLLTPEAVGLSNSDDEEQLKHDYLVDYKTHLVDQTRSPLMPYESNIAKYMMAQIWDDRNHSLLPTNKFYSEFVYAAMRFISSIVKNRATSDGGSGSRVTRSARKSSYFTGERDYADDDEDCQQAYLNFIILHTRTTTCRYFIPLFHLFAKMSQEVRDHNVEVYHQSKSAFDPEGTMSAEDLVTQMLIHGAFKGLYFNGSPQKILELWESQKK